MEPHNIWPYSSARCGFLYPNEERQTGFDRIVRGLPACRLKLR